MTSLRWMASCKTPSKIYITRVLNFGTWEEWQGVKRRFSAKTIQEAVRDPLRGQWTRRGKAFAETLYDCKLPKEALISFDV